MRWLLSCIIAPKLVTAWPVVLDSTSSPGFQHYVALLFTSFQCLGFTRPKTFLLQGASLLSPLAETIKCVDILRRLRMNISSYITTLFQDSLNSLSCCPCLLSLESPFPRINHFLHRDLSHNILCLSSPLSYLAIVAFLSQLYPRYHQYY